MPKPATIAELQAEIARLKATKTHALTIKAGTKGGVSVCGLGRFPVTLYPDQWLPLLERADDIRAFIETHKSVLSFKAA